MGDFDKGASGKLPPKMVGQHRWMVLVAYTMTEGEVIQAHTGGEIYLDHENRFILQTSCHDCGLPVGEAILGPCRDTMEAPDAQPPGLMAAMAAESGIAFTDPRCNASDQPPAGSGDRLNLAGPEIVLVEGFGVQAVVSSSLPDEPVPDVPDVRLLMSMVGETNLEHVDIHHLYLLQPEAVGRMAAQILFGLNSLGPASSRARAAFDERWAEVEAEMGIEAS